MTTSKVAPIEASALLAFGDPARLSAVPSSAGGGTFARACSDLLAGRTGAAERGFLADVTAAMAEGDGYRATLGVALHWFSQNRSLNYLPDGCGTNLIEITLRGGIQPGPSAEAARKLPGAGNASLAAQWINFLGSVPVAMAILRNSSDHPIRHTVLESVQQQCDRIRDDAVALGPSAQAFVERCRAELLARGRQAADAHRALERATAQFRAAGDEVGVAGCLALRGDWAIAPLTTALARNLVLAEPVHPTSELSWPVEAVEGGTDGVDTTAAAAAFEEARAAYQRAGSVGGAAAVSLRQAYLARIRGDHQAQERLAEEAERGFVAAGDEMLAQLAAAHRLLARLDAGRYPEDRQAAANIGTWGKDSGSFSYALGLGLLFTRAGRQTLLREGNAEKAQACFQLSLALHRALGARQREAQTHADLGAIHHVFGNRARAITEYETALTRMTEDPRTKGVDLGSMSVDARASLLLVQLYRDALNHRDAAGMKAAIERFEALPPVGTDMVDLAVRWFVASTRAEGKVLIPAYQGVDAQRRGQPEEAEARFLEALTVARNLPGPEGLFLQGMVQGHRRQYPEAIAAFEQYLDNARDGQAAQLIKIMEKLNPEYAKRELQKLEERAAEQRFMFMVRARAYDRAAAALQVVERRGKDWWRQDPQPWKTLSDIGEMYEGLEDPRHALVYYELAIGELEKQRRFLSSDELKTALAADLGVQYMYFQAVRSAVRLAASLTGAERRATEEKIVVLSERARARALLDLMGNSAAAATPLRAETPELQVWRELAGRSQVWRGLLADARRDSSPGAAELVATLEKKIGQAEDQFHELERKMAKDLPERSQVLGTQAEVATLDQVVASLPPGAALLSYMSLGDDLLTWAITREGLVEAKHTPLPAWKLARQVREFRDRCAEGVSAAELAPEAEALSAVLLAPLAKVIDSHERLIIVPYGELHTLPFAALRWRGDWLGQQRTISHAPSTSILTVLARTKRPIGVGPLLAVGNPAAMARPSRTGAAAVGDLGARPLDPLPGAEREAERIAALYAPDSELRIGPRARESELRPMLKNFRILHLATHGLLYEDAPLLSGIALADGEVLTVYELMSDRLDTDLVTLSACETALGKQTGGEEILGLTRGLLAAGARAAVVTLWSVKDDSTSVLMEEFYRELKETHEPALALRNAQARLRGPSTAERPNLSAPEASDRGPLTRKSPRRPTTGNEPRLWAPFIFIGI